MISQAKSLGAFQWSVPPLDQNLGKASSSCAQQKVLQAATQHSRRLTRYLYYIEKQTFVRASSSEGSASRQPASIESTKKQGWRLPISIDFLKGGLMEEKKGDKNLPPIVQAGDPVLHEPAQAVESSEIGTPELERIIDQMVDVMRAAPGVGLAAPQIGINKQIIVLEDKPEYMTRVDRDELQDQEREPFDLLVVINPKLSKKGRRTAIFLEGCLSVDGYRALVERHLEVEVTGLDRNGDELTVQARGWHARIFQHECDHLAGTLYVDKIVPRTFRTVANLRLPFASGVPRPGPVKDD
ncbi:peptide deformylase [Klebsormidium nitens]|uniref:Peptide deformylase n=1 Tax=Klebsormidium nitens TaxID=105231 RepID=A0A1Y1HMD1_KLENI|nr:peptide deformylase [Klebsormidium nitens]|eukprot:GAQ78852.1 peptide deformylase [Klebsormidium nitens]